MFLQEAIDRLAALKQKDNQIDQLQNENARLRNFEANFENVQVNRQFQLFFLLLLFMFHLEAFSK